MIIKTKFNIGEEVYYARIIVEDFMRYTYKTFGPRRILSITINEGCLIEYQLEGEKHVFEEHICKTQAEAEILALELINKKETNEKEA